MFRIDFYYNNSPSNYIEKNISRYASMLGTLKNSTSIINPIILIQYEVEANVVDDNGDYVYSDYDDKYIVYETELDVFGCNYAYIFAFERYYFITDIVCVRDGLWEIHMSVDVLMSFKDNILRHNAVISRNEYENNPMLVDNLIESEYDFEYEYQEVTGFACDNPANYDVEAEYLYNSTMKFNEECRYCVSCITGNYSANVGGRYGITSSFDMVYVLDENSYYDFVRGLVDPDFLESLFALFESKAKNVLSVSLLPYNPRRLENFSTQPIDHMDIGIGAIGEWSDRTRYNALRYKADLVRCMVLTFCNDYTINVRQDLKSIFEPIRIEPHFNNFMDFEPYTKIDMYLPFYGYTEIDPRLVVGKDFYIIYVVNVIDNSCEIVLTYKPIQPIIANTKNVVIPSTDIILSWHCNLSTPLPFGESGTLEQLKSIAGAAGKIISKGASGAIRYNTNSTVSNNIKRSKKKGTSLASRNMDAYNRGNAISGAVDVFGDTLTDLLTSSPSSAISGTTSNTSMSVGNTVSFRIRRVKPIIPDEYNHLFGRPLLETKRLSDVRGFTVVSAIDLGISGATDAELNEIESILMSGVHFKTN